MSIENKTVTVNGTEFEIEQFGGKQGSRLFKRVLKIVSPVMPLLFEAYQEEGALVGLFGYAGEIFDMFDDELIDSLLSRTTKGKYAIDFDKDFAGEVDTLVLLLMEVIKFNWGKSLANLLQEIPNVLQG